VKNDATAKITSYAQTYGRNQAVAASFVTNAVSITATDALDDGVIEYVAPSVMDLLGQLDGAKVRLGNGQEVTLHTAGAQLQPESMGAFVGFLHSLLDPNLAFIFFWLGLGLLVLFLIVPHHVYAGVLGIAMLVTAIVSFGILPVRIIGILLLVASVVFFVLELKAPGLGIWGILGLVFLLLGGWFLYDRAGGVEVSPWVLVGVAAFAALFFGVVVAAAVKMRNAPSAWTRTVIGEEGVALAAGVGDKGGIVRVSAEEWRAVAPSGPIAGGARVRVLAREGLVLTVEPVTDEPAPSADVSTGQGGTN